MSKPAVPSRCFFTILLLCLMCLMFGCGGRTISGTIWDSESLEALPKVQIRVLSSNNDIDLTTSTDAKGQFQIKGLNPKGTYRLQFSGEIVETKENEYDLSKLSKNKAENCVINMELLCAIEGEITDESGAPIYDAPIQLLVESKSQSSNLVFQAVEYTNINGRFTFFGLRPKKKYSLKVDKPGYKIFDYPPDDSPPFELQRGQIFSTRIKLELIPEMPVPNLKPPKGSEPSASQGGEVIIGE